MLSPLHHPAPSYVSMRLAVCLLLRLAAASSCVSTKAIMQLSKVAILAFLGFAFLFLVDASDECKFMRKTLYTTEGFCKTCGVAGYAVARQCLTKVNDGLCLMCSRQVHPRAHALPCSTGLPPPSPPLLRGQGSHGRRRAGPRGPGV